MVKNMIKINMGGGSGYPVVDYVELNKNLHGSRGQKDVLGGIGITIS